MAPNILERILNDKRRRLAEAERTLDFTALRGAADRARSKSAAFALTAALSRKDRANIIAEIKRASPSRGLICGSPDVIEIASDYEAGGCAAISVLTEEDHFRGSLDDLRAVRSACDLPLLRKDFIVSETQIYESAAAGADAVLLIVAALDRSQLRRFLELSCDELQMDALVEVHTKAELDAAHEAGASIVGVNNRDLRTFQTSLDNSRGLIRARVPGTRYVSESGISTRGEIEELRSLGFDGFLIGETLMGSLDRASAVQTLAEPDAEGQGI